MATPDLRLLATHEGEPGGPLCLRIRDRLREQILSGAILPGSPLPTIRELVDQTSTSVITVQRAVRELQSEGLITGGRGRRLRVSQTIGSREREPRTREVRIERWLFGERHREVLLRRLQARCADAQIAVNRRQPDLCAFDGRSPAHESDPCEDFSGLAARLYGQADSDDALVRALCRNGRLPFFPLEVNTAVVLYNEDILRRAGEAVPEATWSWRDYEECAARVTSRSDGAYGFACDFSMPKFCSALWSMGGTLFSEDGRRCLLGSRQALEAAQACRQLARWGDPSVGVGVGAGSKAMSDSFVQGRSAVVLAGQATCGRARAAGLKVGAVLPPGGAAPLHYMGYGVTPAGARNPLAWELVEEMGRVVSDLYSRNCPLSPLALGVKRRRPDEVDTVFLRAVGAGRSVFSDVTPAHRHAMTETPVHLIESAMANILDPAKPLEATLAETVKGVDRALDMAASGFLSME